MELQIQNLVSSIRKEGIEAANKEADSIIAEAKKKAEAIVAGAKTEAQQYKDGAEKEIAILRESAAVSAERRYRANSRRSLPRISARNFPERLSGN